MEIDLVYLFLHLWDWCQTCSFLFHKNCWLYKYRIPFMFLIFIRSSTWNILSQMCQHHHIHSTTAPSLLPGHCTVILKRPEGDSYIPGVISEKHHDWLRSRLEGEEICLVHVSDLGYCGEFSAEFVEELRQRDDVEDVEVKSDDSNCLFGPKYFKAGHYMVKLKSPDAGSGITVEEVSEKHHEWLSSRLDGEENRLNDILKLHRFIGYSAKLSDSMVKELRQRDDVECIQIHRLYRFDGEWCPSRASSFSNLLVNHYCI